MENQYEAYRQAMRYFAQGLYRTGVGLALTPLSVLPQESQQQFKEAGRDFTNGVATLAHTFASTLDKMAK